MIDTDQFHRFESIDEVYKTFMTHGSNDIEATYNGKEYFISSVWRSVDNIYDKFSIALNHQNKNPIYYKSLDDLLDNYKEDGVPLRDFILNMNVDFVHGVHPDDM